MGAGGVYAAARRDEWCCWAVGFTELGAREGNEWPNGGKASTSAGSITSGPELYWGFRFRIAICCLCVFLSGSTRIFAALIGGWRAGRCLVSSH